MKKVLDVRLKRIAFIFLNEFVYLVFLKLRLGAWQESGPHFRKYVKIWVILCLITNQKKKGFPFQKMTRLSGSL